MALSTVAIICGILELNALIVLAGDFVVIKSPSYVGFVENAKAIETSEIGHVISASFGLPLQKDLRWNGLEEINLFRRPKATAVFSVLGVSGGQLDVPNVVKYQTIEVENNINTADVVNAIESVDWKADPLIVDFYLDGNVFSVDTRHSEVFANLPLTLPAVKDDISSGLIEHWFTPSELGSLNVTNDVDLAFLGELYVIQEIVNTVVENKVLLKTQSPDFFNFQIGKLIALRSLYGDESTQLRDALRLLQTVISRVTEQLQSVYSNNVVIELVTFTPEAAQKPSARRGRSLLQSPTESPVAVILNLAPGYTFLYAPVFNICLWFSIGFGLAVFFISWVIWFMDPGRDSIIYRMTSTRMKRD